MNEDQLFNELKTSIGQAIAYAEGNSTKARKKNGRDQRTRHVLCSRNQGLASTDELNTEVICGIDGRFH